MSKKLKTLVTFTEQFSAMTKAHIPLFKILNNLQNDILDKNFKKTLIDVTSMVERGIAFDEALSNHPKTFNAIYINMVKAGMESGQLALTLKELSTYLVKVLATYSKVKNALTYPIVIFVFFIITSISMMIFVIPNFVKLFLDFGKELPFATKVAMKISNILTEDGVFIFVILFFIVVSTISFLQTDIGKREFDNFKIKIPFLGSLLQKASIARFIRTLGVLTQTGVPILKAIKVAKGSAKNIIIEESIEEIASDIEKGVAISEAFRKSQMFSELIIQMINSGEEGGNLDELLITTANYYDEMVDSELSFLTTVLNPLITAIVSIFVLFLMVATYQPIFQMGDLF